MEHACEGARAVRRQAIDQPDDTAERCSVPDCVACRQDSARDGRRQAGSRETGVAPLAGGCCARRRDHEGAEDDESDDAHRPRVMSIAIRSKADGRGLTDS